MAMMALIKIRMMWRWLWKGASGRATLESQQKTLKDVISGVSGKIVNEQRSESESEGADCVYAGEARWPPALVCARDAYDKGLALAVLESHETDRALCRDRLVASSAGRGKRLVLFCLFTGHRGCTPVRGQISEPEQTARVGAQQLMPLIRSQRGGSFANKTRRFKGGIDVWEIRAPQHSVLTHEVHHRTDSAFFGLGDDPEVPAKIVRWLELG